MLLLSVIPVQCGSPLVTQFQIQQTMAFHLQLVVLLDYADGLLQYFSKPQALETKLVSKSLSISLAPRLTTVSKSLSFVKAS